MPEAVLLEPDSTASPTAEPSSGDFVRPPDSDELQVDGLERKTANATLQELLTSLELDENIENDANKQAVLSLAAEAWSQTEGLSPDGATETRQWLLDVMLRAVGEDSGYVQSHHLTEYLPDSQEANSFGELFAQHGQSEMSRHFAAAASGVAQEFGFDRKFPGQEEPEVEYCVVPADNSSSLAALINGSGALARLPNGKRGIFINEGAYQRSFGNSTDTDARLSRAFIAHELGHARRELLVGGGPRPLGHMVNELYAEWCGNDKGAFYTEKHISNLLSSAGIDIRKDYLPKMAAGEMTMADVIGALKDKFGALNTLRILAYEPANYVPKYPEDPAKLVGDCIDYATKHGKITPEQLESNINAKYSPRVAKILITNSNISRLIPANLYTFIERRALTEPLD